MCGHAYTGGTDIKNLKRGTCYRRLYRCTGKKRDLFPFDSCRNKSWGADKFEDLVWAELQKYLNDGDLIIVEIEKQRRK
jgi:hypothetical protein